MKSLKHQNGNILVVVSLAMASFIFYLSLYVESQSKSNNKLFVEEVRTQLELYLSALDLYGQTYCNVSGAISILDIYPAFTSIRWKDPLNSSVDFNIDGASGKRTIEITFNNASYFTSLANVNWVDIMVVKEAGSKKLTFSRGRESAPSLGRANHNRNLFISATPNGC